MRILVPCPACGKATWRPEHAEEAHGAEVPSLEALKEWADGHGGLERFPA